MPSTEQPLFREVQRFHQLWIRLTVWICAVGSFLPLVLGLIDGRLLREGETDEWVIAGLIALFGVFLVRLFSWLHLVIEVHRDHVLVRFAPLRRKTILLDDITRFEPRTYRPILEYGGWGIRWSPRHGKAYNVSGNRGVQLELHNGKHILLGSQRAEELAAAIRKAKSGS